MCTAHVSTLCACAISRLSLPLHAGTEMLTTAEHTLLVVNYYLAVLVVDVLCHFSVLGSHHLSHSAQLPDTDSRNIALWNKKSAQASLTQNGCRNMQAAQAHRQLPLPDKWLADGQHARVPDDNRPQGSPVPGTHLHTKARGVSTHPAPAP